MRFFFWMDSRVWRGTRINPDSEFGTVHSFFPTLAWNGVTTLHPRNSQQLSHSIFPRWQIVQIFVIVRKMKIILFVFTIGKYFTLSFLICIFYRTLCRDWIWIRCCEELPFEIQFLWCLEPRRHPRSHKPDSLDNKFLPCKSRGFKFLNGRFCYIGSYFIIWSIVFPSSYFSMIWAASFFKFSSFLSAGDGSLPCFSR